MRMQKVVFTVMTDIVSGTLIAHFENQTTEEIQ